MEAPGDVSMIPFPEGTVDIDTPADALSHLGGNEGSNPGGNGGRAH